MNSGMAQCIAQTHRFRQPVQERFTRQGAMRTLSARLERGETEEVDFAVEWTDGIAPPHGFVRAVRLSDACNLWMRLCAASATEPNAAELTVEFKNNLLAERVASDFACRGKAARLAAHSRLPRAALMQWPGIGRRCFPTCPAHRRPYRGESASATDLSLPHHNRRHT